MCPRNKTGCVEASKIWGTQGRSTQKLGHTGGKYTKFGGHRGEVHKIWGTQGGSTQNMKYTEENYTKFGEHSVQRVKQEVKIKTRF